MRTSFHRRPLLRRRWTASLLLAAAVLGSCGRDSLLSPDGDGPLEIDVPLKRVSPDSAFAGSPTLEITVTGRSFGRNSVVRWDGKDLATVSAGKTQLLASVGAAELAAGGVREVRVFTPGLASGLGGSRRGTLSPPLPFTVYYAPPQVTRIAPDSAPAGTAGLEVAVEGTGFAPASLARWNGQPRPTRFVSRTQLAVTLDSADLRTAALAAVTVFNPAPGGGVSLPDTFVVANPSPRLGYLHTRGATAGGGGFTLAVAGEGFVPASTVHWNGAPRPTTYLGPTRLLAAIAGPDVAGAGTRQVTVVSPGPGGGTSNAAPVTVRQPGAATTTQTTLQLSVRDLVWDPGTARIYATLAAGADSNSIAVINPVSGVLEATVPIGSRPSRLARSADGQFLYVGIDGEGKVRRFDIAARTAGPSFSLGSSWYDASPLMAEDISVMPDSPHVVAVSIRNRPLSPRHEGVAIFDHGVRRPTQTPGHTGSNVIEFGATADVLWGQNTETTEFGFRRMRVDASGVVVTDVRQDLIGGFGREIAFAAGRVYSTQGSVVDPERMLSLGTCSPGTIGAEDVDVDVEAGRFYLLDDFGYQVRVCDANTFALLGSLSTPYLWTFNGRAHLVRWGSDGLAYHDDDEVFIVRSPIVSTGP
jgi:DNA-binding beta-propeller fold protein YncE